MQTGRNLSLYTLGVKKKNQEVFKKVITFTYFLSAKDSKNTATNSWLVPLATLGFNRHKSIVYEDWKKGNVDLTNEL